MGSQRVHLQLSIEVDSEPISGSVSNGDARAQPFTGWIDLAAAIEAARLGAPVVTPRHAAGPDGAKTLGSLPGANRSEP